jgi:hypothetical protein
LGILPVDIRRDPCGIGRAASALSVLSTPSRRIANSAASTAIDTSVGTFGGLIDLQRPGPSAALHTKTFPKSTVKANAHNGCGGGTTVKAIEGIVAPFGDWRPSFSHLP